MYKKAVSLFSVLVVLIGMVGCATAQARGPASAVKNIVIVHGAFADGSGWEGVYHKLKEDKYNVTIVQIPTSSLAADVTATQNVLAAQNGPVVLVGHSYGGVVITQAGNDSKVKSLVYVAAYVPDAGESVGDLLAKADKSVPAPHIMPYSFGADGKPATLIVNRDNFPEEFAADVDLTKAQFMADSEIPIGAQVLSDKVTKAAWKIKPSYYIVSKQDRMIPPNDERMFATKAKAVRVKELDASHAVFMSTSENENEVVTMIEEAALSQ